MAARKTLKIFFVTRLGQISLSFLRTTLRQHSLCLAELHLNADWKRNCAWTGWGESGAGANQDKGGGGPVQKSRKVSHFSQVLTRSRASPTSFVGYTWGGFRPAWCGAISGHCAVFAAVPCSRINHWIRAALQTALRNPKRKDWKCRQFRKNG